MSILPSFLNTDIPDSSDTTLLTIPREYGIDFESGLLNGRTVEGIEAIKVWIWNCLHTERYRYAIYSWQYGVEYEQYVGQTLSDEYIQADCLVETENALLTNPYITGIEDFTAELDGALLHITFTVNTKLGKIEVNEYV